ncbi:hypothetical protein AS156_28555 [Bradyrhizobium macuxiense]|uniref:Uncharacterized protein n=1 Tax=Bradyrhizobium macuxiense TaxID=1755647 RepID=A0A109K498_9BRAD|nr:hypothetical protein [Bradyrhizobium macuxiense]KWV60534.1 hypothetical protein AS156_28555 [Bradyrhizobium macuxiense]
MSYAFDLECLVERDDRHVVTEGVIATCLTMSEAENIAERLCWDYPTAGVVIWRVPYDRELHLHIDGEPKKLMYIGKDLRWSGYDRSWVVDRK